MILPQKQEARRRHKELRYIWSREQLIEDDQNRDEASLHETNLTPHPDGQSIRFQLSSYSTLCTTASGNDQERHPNLVCDQGSEVAKLQYQSGSIRLQSPTGLNLLLFISDQCCIDQSVIICLCM